jgi:hypothetical protein
MPRVGGGREKEFIWHTRSFLCGLEAIFNGRSGFTFGRSELGVWFFEGGWTWTDVSHDTVFCSNDSPLFVLFFFDLLAAVFAVGAAAAAEVDLALCCRLSCVGGFLSIDYGTADASLPLFSRPFRSHGADGVGPRRFKVHALPFVFSFVTYCVVLGCFMHSTRSGRWYIVQRWLEGRWPVDGFMLRC